MWFKIYHDLSRSIQFLGEKELAEAKFNEKPQDVRGPFPCCGPPPCPVAPPCSRLARSDGSQTSVELLL